MYHGNEIVTYQAGQMQISGMTANACSNLGDYNIGIDNCIIPNQNYYPLYQQHYHNWFSSTGFCEKSKVEQGFKIVGKMIENKIITKDLTIKEFIKLVNDIAELL